MTRSHHKAATTHSTSSRPGGIKYPRLRTLHQPSSGTRRSSSALLLGGMRSARRRIRAVLVRSRGEKTEPMLHST